MADLDTLFKLKRERVCVWNCFGELTQSHNLVGRSPFFKGTVGRSLFKKKRVALDLLI